MEVRVDSRGRIVGCVSACLPPGPTTDCLATCPVDSVCLEGQCINAVPREPLPSFFCLAEDGTIGISCYLGVCAHPLDDAKNCGSCGNACGPGGTCVNGSCSNFPGCGNGRMGFFCDLDAGPNFLCCPSAGCTDTWTDRRNCLNCGNTCPPGQACVLGNCQ